jgi:hypothetical protein
MKKYVAPDKILVWMAAGRDFLRQRSQKQFGGI